MCLGWSLPFPSTSPPLRVSQWVRTRPTFLAKTGGAPSFWAGDLAGLTFKVPLTKDTVVLWGFSCFFLFLFLWHCDWACWLTSLLLCCWRAQNQCVLLRDPGAPYCPLGAAQIQGPTITKGVISCSAPQVFLPLLQVFHYTLFQHPTPAQTLPYGSCYSCGVSKYQRKGEICGEKDTGAPQKAQ